MQQECDQAAIVLRPYTNARDQKESVEMRGFTAGGTTEYRTAITRSRDGEEMEGGFSSEKPTAPGSCCHVDTSSAAQEGPVVQGFADGNVAVIGHHEDEEKDLGSTSCIGDVPGVPQGIRHGFGDSGGDAAQVEEGEVEEEEVHGGVEAVVTGYGSDDEAVAQEGSQVDAQEEPEVQELQLPCVCKCQEEELGDGAAIRHLLPLEGHGHVAGELQHGSAGALDAEEVVHALDPTALRAEALLAGTGGGTVQVRNTLMGPAEVKLVLSIGRGVAEGTLGGFWQTY
ncbi:hypothetical protein QYF61_010309 [Mycteria americana]|uniref:Uncharacterized protein n=1 Tax=Mycteria americana TaxID=33587 RepID=A0AAN7MGY7_MYCAM|nr:hypothetical protein QYF61_010309 [Mycteria americana]